MPIRFTCPHCGQLLSVGQKKVGQPVQCTHCRGGVIVPAPLSPETPAAETPAQDRPSPLTAPSPTTEGTPDWDSLVPVSRGALYSIGALIFAVAAVAFLLGWAMGRDASLNRAIAEVNTAQRIQGRIQYMTDTERTAADSEAVVLALPLTHKPDEKLDIEAVRPDLPPPGIQDPTVQAIRSLGGDVTRAGPHGEYELQLPASGSYYVLILSSHARRARSAPPTSTEIVELGQYFKRANQLLGDNDYSWSKQLLRNNKRLDYRFGGS